MSDLQENGREDVQDHADVTTAFLEWLEVWPEGWENLDIRAAIVDNVVFTPRTLLEELEGCKQVVPSRYCKHLELPLPRVPTYDDMVWAIKRELDLD